MQVPKVTLFLCKICSQPIVRPLIEEERGSRDEQRFMDREGFPAGAGSEWVSEGYFFTTETGDYSVNSCSLIGISKHPDPYRWVGCCGAPPEGSLNITCGSGHEIGRMVTECYFPWYTRLSSTCVHRFQDQSGSLEVLYQLYLDLNNVHPPLQRDLLTKTDRYLGEMINLFPYIHTEDLLESLVIHCKTCYPERLISAALYSRLMNMVVSVGLDPEILLLLLESDP